MITRKLKHDPYNLIITGVGGQGNVISSRIIGNMLSCAGFYVTIGETFGASQRGGSVMSHVRISSKDVLSPQIPLGMAHMVVSLEPVEAIRVLSSYGNPDVKVICNTQPTHPIGVISGRLDYPSGEKIKQSLNKLASKIWLFNATNIALGIGDPIFTNIIMAGALSATRELPLSRDIFKTSIETQ
ncbi:MAG: indolepyruvate oxidoreductase subunit beta, partial [Desulfobacula sp.]|nr:indolepyruvate oxidoreductase subunit beta [Desulfobacula sp.]